MRTIERQVNVAYIYTPPMTCINLTRTPTKQSYIGGQPGEEKKKDEHSSDVRTAGSRQWVMAGEPRAWRSDEFASGKNREGKEIAA